MSNRIHLAPSSWATFEAPGFVVVSFVPQIAVADLEAEELPSYHRNIDMDEVMLSHADDNPSGRRPGSVPPHPARHPARRQRGIPRRISGPSASPACGARARWSASTPTGRSDPRRSLCGWPDDGRQRSDLAGACGAPPARCLAPYLWGSLRGHLDLHRHAQRIRRETGPGAGDRHRLARIAHDGDADQVVVADDAVRRIELDPAGPGQINAQPGVGGAAADPPAAPVSGT